MATAEAGADGSPSRGIDFSGASGTAERHAGIADEDARRDRIAELAYRLAEQRGFAPGAELDDWISAERLVDADRDLPS